MSVTPIEKVIYTAKAHTTGGRDGGSSRTSDGRLDVGVVHDHAGALATQLEQQALHGAPGLLGDDHPDLGRPGEAHAVDVGRFDQRHLARDRQARRYASSHRSAHNV